MKRSIIVVLILIVFKSQLWSQHYITPGVGFIGISHNSKDLDNFKDTYNKVNGDKLSKLMGGMGAILGIRGEIGYRYLGNIAAAIKAGYIKCEGQDDAQFINGDSRNLEFKMNSMYVECELGHTHETYFLSGVLTLYFNRETLINSTYSGPAEEISKRTLNGVYKSKNSYSIDFGIAVGIIRKPIFIISKITYPVFTGGKSNILRDREQEVLNKKRKIFPDDYIAYSYGTYYDGVSSAIDGLKFTLTINYAIPMN